MYMANGYRRGIWLVAALALTGAGSSALRAQESEAAEPLLKTDLVRMMALGDYADDELLHIVRMNCVSFSPTARDHADLGALPGGESVLAEIQRCRNSTRPAAGFDRGIPRARPVTGAQEAPANELDLELQVTALPGDPLARRPALQEPRFTIIVEDDAGAVTASEVPPRLQNWDQVSRQLLQQYRPLERREGTVVLRVRVDESGRAADSLLTRSSGDPQLDAAVLATVPAMRFSPALSRDRKVAAWTELPIQFETP